MHNDSVEKIITRYFATVTTVPFSYKGKTFDPQPLKVSPLAVALTREQVLEAERRAANNCVSQPVATDSTLNRRRE